MVETAQYALVHTAAEVLVVAMADGQPVDRKARRGRWHERMFSTVLNRNGVLEAHRGKVFEPCAELQNVTYCWLVIDSF